jgi:hypothetical protein
MPRRALIRLGDTLARRAKAINLGLMPVFDFGFLDIFFRQFELKRSYGIFELKLYSL